MDLAALPVGYRIQLVPAEYAPGGPFHRLTTWLDAHMHTFGFFRPYTTDRGGVMPEPWHLSHAPVAARAQRALSLSGLRAVLAASDIDGKEAVLAALEENFRRYVVDVDAPPEAARVQPQTFLIAPSISVRVVLIESSTPVKIGGCRRSRRQFSLRKIRCRYSRLRSIDSMYGLRPSNRISR